MWCHWQQGLLCHLLQQCLRLLQIRRVEPLGEPAGDRGQQVVGLLALVLGLPQARQAGSGTEFLGFGLLSCEQVHGRAWVKRACVLPIRQHCARPSDAREWGDYGPGAREFCAARDWPRPYDPRSASPQRARKGPARSNGQALAAATVGLRYPAPARSAADQAVIREIVLVLTSYLRAGSARVAPSARRRRASVCGASCSSGGHPMCCPR